MGEVLPLSEIDNIQAPVMKVERLPSSSDHVSHLKPRVASAPDQEAPPVDVDND